MTRKLRAYCWICGKEVPLEHCKTDEHGHAVHDYCYSTRVKLEGESSRKHASRAERTQN